MEDIKRFIDADPDTNGGYREILKMIGARAKETLDLKSGGSITKDSLIFSN
jgi:hypothetical protein